MAKDEKLDIQSSSLSSYSSKNVYFFVPNLIGYTRIILALISFYYLSFNPFLAMFYYSLSCLLDAFDGYAARVLNQSTQFGAVLDMVTDRSTTSCLLVQLSHLYPQYTLWFQMLIALDLSSHYMQMYSALTQGSQSHKQVSETTHPLLKLYYTSRVVLFCVCAGNELFFMMLYLIKFSDHPVWSITLWIMFPVFALKQILNVVQLVGASQILVEEDYQKHVQQQKQYSNTESSLSDSLTQDHTIEENVDVFSTPIKKMSNPGRSSSSTSPNRKSPRLKNRKDE